ncbi:serine hydrolase [Bradyrhizobium sp. DASA03068]|uniref:serine hydrolase n=1 Tax=Bradyrhizobium sp. BLXBL-01 TaxID=3395915 RepID=UPI003F71F031
MASITKTFTGTAFLQVAEQRRLDLYDHVRAACRTLPLRPGSLSLDQHPPLSDPKLRLGRRRLRAHRLGR